MISNLRPLLINNTPKPTVRRNSSELRSRPAEPVHDADDGHQDQQIARGTEIGDLAEELRGRRRRVIWAPLRHRLVPPGEAPGRVHRVVEHGTDDERGREQHREGHGDRGPADHPLVHRGQDTAQTGMVLDPFQ